MSDLKPHKLTTDSSASFLGFNDLPADTAKNSSPTKKELSDLAGFLDVLVQIDLAKRKPNK